MRCFLAVEIPDEICAALARLQQELRRATTLRVRWADPATFHLTLKFLGDTSAEQHDRLVALLADPVAARGALGIELAGAGAFPPGRRPRTIWAGVVRGGEALAALADAVDRAAAAVGFPRETRPFHPHVTLGRVRAPRPAPDLVAALEERRTVPLGAWTPAAVTLVESRLGPGGARHRPIRQWPFGARESAS